MSVPNLTRDDAQVRAELLDVESYDVAVDLTDGAGEPSERTFRSRTTVTFRAARSGASTFLDVIADRFNSVTLNGKAVDVSAYDPANGIVLPELARENIVVVDADLLYTNTGEGCTASSTRSTARSTSTPSSRPPTPSACTPASTSPT